MYKVQRFGVGQSPRIPGGKPPAVTNLNRQCGPGLDVKHDSSSLVGTPVLNPACGEVSIQQVGKVLIEVRKALGQVLAKAFEHSAHVLVEPRFDYLGGPLVFLLESVPALRNLVSQCGDLEGDLLECARAAVDAAEITFEFSR